MDDSVEDLDEEEEDASAAFGSEAMASSDSGDLGNNGALQDTQVPFISYPPGSAMFYRTPVAQTENREVHPRAEIVTSAEGNHPGTALRSHPSYESLRNVEEDALTLNGRLEVPASTSRVRNDSDSSGVHSSREEDGLTEGVCDQLEECVPNSELDPLAPRFRARCAESRHYCQPASTASSGSVNENNPTEVSSAPRPELENQDNEIFEWPEQNGGTYDERLQTFLSGNWDHFFMTAEVLAEAGFFYTGNGDAAVCAGCGEVLSNWGPGDDPRQEHRQHFGRDCF